jgi:hypothetical protein
MGEYARYYTLERFGVDIGDDDDRSHKPKKDWKWSCKICDKRLGSEVANRDHMRDKHAITKAEGSA